MRRLKKARASCRKLAMGKRNPQNRSDAVNAWGRRPMAIIPWPPQGNIGCDRRSARPYRATTNYLSLSFGARP
jgi:hypothetical protein